MLSVDLMTLAERKVMGSMQRRVGPNKVGIWGILQPLGGISANRRNWVKCSYCINILKWINHVNQDD